MTLGLAFWVLMLSVWWNWPNHYMVGGNLLLLGWHSFGAPIHG